MKRIITAAAVLMLTIFAATALHANEINVTIDGVAVDFEGQPPVIVDGRTLVPVRGVFEALGFNVDWHQPTQTATLTSADYAIIISIGSGSFTTNGASHILDVPAQIIGGRTMLPIRAVLESVGYNVDWEAATATVLISTESPSSFAAPIPREDWRTDITRMPIAATFSTSFAILEDGSLWGWGNNSTWLLDYNSPIGHPHGSPVKIMDSVLAVSAGRIHVVAIRADGSLWGWGNNESGQLGIGTTTIRQSPVKIMEDVIAVSAGSDHTMAIRADGSLWGWGDSVHGQLGDGSNVPFEIDRDSGSIIRVPQVYPIKILGDVVSVSAGRTHTMAIRADGSLWGWGENSFGQIGDGCEGFVETRYGHIGISLRQLYPKKIMDDVVAVSAGYLETMAVRVDGSLWTWGWDSFRAPDGSSTWVTHPSPRRIMDNVLSVSASNGHRATITNNGNLYAWGINWFGRIGVGDNGDCFRIPTRVTSNVAAVVTANDHTMVVKTDGSLWDWGGFPAASEHTRIMDNVMLP